MGKGLNSFRIRFAIATAAILFTLLGIETFVEHNEGDSAWISPVIHTALILYGLGGTALIYWMTGKLTKPIEALKASTEAIARGDFDSEVDVDCSCEIGGLAASFRTMVARLNANVAKINTLAFEDGITGLPNRAALQMVMENFGRWRGAVLFIDLDKFKQVNDTLGHHVGDRLLRAVAHRITTEALDLGGASEAPRLINALDEAQRPETQALFRFAGDEFIALIPGSTDRVRLAAIASRIITSVSAPFILDEEEVQIGATIGISIFPADSADIADILNCADLAMYSAKAEGRGRYAFFSEGMRQDAIERAQLEADLRAGLDSEQFVAHYQPKIDARTGEIRGVEALVRWQHPTRGLLYPGAFLPIAEQSGFIDRIARLVAADAARQSRLWSDAGFDIPISVNICPSQFLNPEFSDNVLDFLAQTGMKPHLFELELTENIAMQDPENACRQLKKLKAAGVRIAIDDFGTGYSNLSQLYKMPFDVLKFDRSLIEQIGVDQRGEFILTSMIGMAHALDHEVVAEGVETAEQFNFLSMAGADQIQGFYFARPMPAEALDAWRLSRDKRALPKAG